ncbi:Trm112 family protein [Streptomyces clavuligerus]|uniref:Trm112p domain-containing protein n=1 Tax=Streptomyces clavuligerus TaxID=1901 RepID=E2PZE6_STRCL|nr:Trm112 family protein [Streptomyces clavuligerus]ANW17139.1 hypothetical protein BB341_02355 [Streptomyces clavuligerus]AXU11679.1 Trm112 family protein [Streptomyces clavuligerus]EFG10407.1 Trm112p domain-containing protein [Streptomyces clavuligerus]MBY6301519.1 Trm112 family protein [Streptomyces clavuligerus]QCS04459.1 hypothetical protein CRV15_01890 [Streptomyces clavuligerus]
MNPADPLLAFLVCPLDKGPLRPVLSGTASVEALYNPRLRRLYPIVGGVPRLLPASGAPVSAGEHERLTRQGAP